MEKVKIEYRAERRNKIKGRKSQSNTFIDNFKSEHKPYTKNYDIALAKHMLTYSNDFTFIKKMTGLSKLKMLELGLLEYYYPFKKSIINPKPTGIGDSMLLVEDISIKWLRRKI